MPPSYEESLNRAVGTLHRVRGWRLPYESWQEVEKALHVLREAVRSHDTGGLLTAVSRVELAGPRRGAPRLTSEIAQQDPQAIPDLVSELVDRIGADVRASRGGDGD